MLTFFTYSVLLICLLIYPSSTLFTVQYISWHVMGYWTPSKSTPLVLKIFNPHPSPQILTSPPSDWKWLLLHFSHMATSNKHMFTFLKLLQLIKYHHNWFLKKLKQYIKEIHFYHHFSIFSHVMTSHSLTLCKFRGWMIKNFIPCNFSWRVSAETWDASCFKKGLLENNSDPLAMHSHWKRYFFRT